MNGMEIARTLCEILKERTGCDFSPEYIQTDDSRHCANYIVTRALHRNCPVIMMHYMGIRLVFIPYEDWHLIAKGEVTIHEYVDKAVWNYGYYWGFDTLQSGGICWQPLEDGKPGINDKEKIRRYLTILKCRAYEHYRNEQPMLVWCSDCYLQKCPMSVLPRKREGASWEDEPEERHVRKEFYEAISERLKKRFEFEVRSFGMSKELNPSKRTVYLFKGFVPGTVKVLVSEAVIVDMMYHPEKYDIQKMIQRVIWIAAVQRYDKLSREFVIDKQVRITRQTKLDEIIEFWNEDNT